MKKSWLPLAMWYSGRYLPARGKGEGFVLRYIDKILGGEGEGVFYLGASPILGLVPLVRLGNRVFRSTFGALCGLNIPLAVRRRRSFLRGAKLVILEDLVQE